MKITKHFTFLLVFLFIGTFLKAQTAFDNATNGVQKIMTETPIVGMSVAVVKDNKIIYTHSFGLKNVATGAALTDENIFRIASISKSFSSTSIMQLVEAGKLSLDNDVSDLIGFKVRNPKYPETVITLKLLLSHLSSINDKQGYFTLDSLNPEKNPNWAISYNDYEPGKGYEYCNLNYNMTGTIIEKISGERFDQYVKHHILVPLGLYGGYCVDSLDKNKFATIYEYNELTKQYTESPNAYAPRSKEIANYTMGYSTPIFSPTGGMKISATGLATYMMMHMNYGKYKGGRIISKSSSKQMQTPLSEEEHYGFAIENTTKMIDGVELTGHTGSAYGLFSAMFFQPKEKYGIVVISNGCPPQYIGGYNDVIKRTVNVLYDNLIKKVY